MPRKKPHLPVALVVPHTHWDRAWYWPFERFRGRLCELWDHVLEEFERVPGYRYTTDGQAAMVDDYLEIRPDRRAVISKLARQGKLKIGPCYVLPDVYCTGGEAQIRNLLIGLEISRALGGAAGTLNVLYYADTFGIIPEVPMLACGFGFDCFLFMRGHTDEMPGMVDMVSLERFTAGVPSSQTRMFRWESADGSGIRVFRLRDGYGNAAGLGHYLEPDQTPSRSLELEADMLLKTTQKQNDAQGEPLLLLAGVDHAFPQTRLPAILKIVGKSGEFDFRWSHLDDLGAAVVAKTLPRGPAYRGEFHGSGASSVLGGTVSSRIALKQENAAVERLLSHTAEPVAAAAAFLDRPEPSAPQLRVAWKELLKDHQHDGICGCSVDAVHRATFSHLQEVREAGDGVRRRGFVHLYRHFGGNRVGDARPSFALFNPQMVSQRTVVRYALDFEGLRKWGDLRLPARYRVVDEAGKAVPFREANRQPSTEHPHMVARLDLAPLVPGGSFARFYLEETEAWPLTRLPAPRTLENARLRVVLRADGTADLTDKRTRRTWKGLGFLSDQPDVGDSYDFADAENAPETVFRDLAWEIVPGSGCSGMQCLTARTVLRLSAGWDDAADAPELAPVEIPVEVDWLLAPGWSHVETRVRFTNNARDHRLRWNLALPERPEQTRAGLKFQEVVRPPGEQPPWGPPPRVHPEHPADLFVAAESRRGGLALFTEFPCNYEYRDDGGPRLAVAMLRAFGWLTRPQVSHTRGSANAGPHTRTPEAQCLGQAFEMRYAVRPFTPAEAGQLFYEAALWRHPPAAGQADAAVPHPERPVKSPDLSKSPLWQAEGEVFVSALKPPHRLEAGGFVMRLLNPRPETATVTLSFAKPVLLVPVNLNEEPFLSPKKIVATRKARWRVTLGPWQLATYHLVLD